MKKRLRVLFVLLTTAVLALAVTAASAAGITPVGPAAQSGSPLLPLHALAPSASVPSATFNAVGLYTLTYDNFVGTCSATGFSTTTTGHYSLATDVTVNGHTTLDGVKYYTRAGMGRCQGGFCTYRVMRLISRETGLPLERISKHGPGSELVTGHIGGAQDRGGS